MTSVNDTGFQQSCDTSLLYHGRLWQNGHAKQLLVPHALMIYESTAQNNRVVNFLSIQAILISVCHRAYIISVLLA